MNRRSLKKISGALGGFGLVAAVAYAAYAKTEEAANAQPKEDAKPPSVKGTARSAANRASGNTHGQPVRKAIGQTASTAVGRPITTKEMLNCVCVIPALFSNPDSSQQMKDGKYKIEDESLKNSMHGCEEGDLGSPTSGIMNGKQMGAAYLMWNTGGTQWWTSFILFERVKGKVIGNRHCSIGHPFNKGQVVNLRIADNKLFFDVKNGPLAFRPTNYDNFPERDDNPSKVPIEPQQITNLTVFVPTEDRLNNEDGITEPIKLTNGVYKSKALTCRINKVSKVKIQDELATLATATITYKGKVPLHGVFKFQRRKGKPVCEGFYSACNEYAIGDMSARIDHDKFSRYNGEVVVDVHDGRLNFSDFREADYEEHD